MGHAESAVAARTLYERLGSNAGIKAIVDDVIAAHLASPVVGERFRKVQDLDRAKRMATQFFCAGAGGPEQYTGKDMRAAHKGMDINDAEYAAVVDDIMTVLRSHAIDAGTQKDVQAILDSLKAEIVRA